MVCKNWKRIAISVTLCFSASAAQNPCALRMEAELDFWLPDESSEVGGAVLGLPKEIARLVRIKPQLNNMEVIPHSNSNQQGYILVGDMIQRDPHLAPIFLASSKLSANGQAYLPVLKIETQSNQQRITYWNAVDQRTDVLNVPANRAPLRFAETPNGSYAKPERTSPVTFRSFNYADQLELHGLEAKVKELTEPVAFLLWDNEGPDAVRVEYIWTNEAVRQQGIALNLIEGMVAENPRLRHISGTMTDVNQATFFAAIGGSLKSQGLLDPAVSGADFIANPKKYFTACCSNRPQILNDLAKAAFKTTPFYKINSKLGFANVSFIEIKDPFTDPTVNVTTSKSVP